MALTINGTHGLTFPNDSTQTVGAIGDGQTWQDVTISRALSTTYTNTTNKPIMVIVEAGQASGSGTVALTVDGLVISNQQVSGTGGSNTRLTATGIVPQGATYSATGTALLKWTELR
jgi:hypothetical protein